MYFILLSTQICSVGIMFWIIFDVYHNFLPKVATITTYFIPSNALSLNLSEYSHSRNKIAQMPDAQSMFMAGHTHLTHHILYRRTKLRTVLISYWSLSQICPLYQQNFQDNYLKSFLKKKTKMHKYKDKALLHSLIYKN